ncbi:uncharacterized protein BO87DRAFT_143649 [Aspergillus neoniger CBS 115656]|uniref:Uncharacterized protein n=1 Tax=Aspergillus neoniger (strain CBS 115656) TaxID=1448310 RepID=A0A318Y9L3_ASPNB|nr:hypothetical protein BO87DRAFT_143649 [Aspergillus neoniger CBS 115656]PYH31011.1 hypothetical protein BO87DRAFT_143649 [Aspergillus neoniger CBS 115656]
MTFLKIQSDKQGYFFLTELTEACLSFPKYSLGTCPILYQPGGNWKIVRLCLCTTRDWERWRLRVEMRRFVTTKVTNHLQNGDLLDAPSGWPMLSRTRIDTINSVDLHAKVAAHRRAGTSSAPKRKRMNREWGSRSRVQAFPGRTSAPSRGNPNFRGESLKMRAQKRKSNTPKGKLKGKK